MTRYSVHVLMLLCSVAALSAVPLPAGVWQEAAPMPASPSGRAVKDGGWLTYNPGDGLLYAAKGYKTGDFYSYNPAINSWFILPLIPDGSEGKPAGKGSSGVSDGERYIYCTKGNNTVGFWRYDVDSAVWQQRADVPTGFTNKKVKGGTDLVYVGDSTVPSIYLLKGYKNEFWRYDVTADTWYFQPLAPGRASIKWDRGSFLAPDGAGGILAHKAKYHEMYRFDLSEGTWDTLPRLTGMPLFSRATGRTKKSKDGGAGAWHSGSVYALKGGNTQEFWRYFTSRDSWVELETIPAYGTTGKKKRVKAGADIVSTGGGVFYALKGNKTGELWRYSLDTAGVRHAATPRSGAQAEPGRRAADCRLRVAQNPTRGTATIRWSGSSSLAPCPSTLSLYDASGRLVLVRSIGSAASGTARLDLRFLPSDVYFVRLTSAGRAAEQKLVLRK
ncbi:MAG: T9SS type A sorting domain-containing protein [bacterium]